MLLTVRVLALLVAGLLGALSLLHVYWGFGGRTAWLAALPERAGRPAFVPSRAGTFAVAVALGAAATVVAIGGRLIASPMPIGVVHGAIYVLGLVLVARSIGDFRLVGFFKSVRGTRFARCDTWLYAPAGLALGVASVCVGYFDV